MEARIQFDRVGIAEAIKRHRLCVPPHQREYAWGTRHVRDLLTDIAASMRKGRPLYFLGTVVFTTHAHGGFEIADGQQRLATTTILLAAFRDIFLELQDDIRAQSLESDFLFTIDLARRERLPRLTMNADDRDFFLACILTRPAEREEPAPVSRDSHRRLLAARETIQKYFAELRSQCDAASFPDSLLRWIEYLCDGATIITVGVPDEIDAYLMFETLNDRGLRASQVDLVKSHLFKEAGEQGPAAQQSWSVMRRTIEAIGEDDHVIDFLRLVCNVLHGPTRERDVFERIKAANKGSRDCLHFLASLRDLAANYAAILSPDHPKWNVYSPDIRASIRTLKLFTSGQMRPLLLAVASLFSKPDAARAFKRLVAWTVRFIVCGGAQDGDLDQWYCELANAVHRGRIQGLSDLDQAARSMVPTDARFKAYFETARVDSANIARYKLGSLEREASKVPNPEWLVDEHSAINLEHVMPRAGSTDWSHVAADEVESHADRLGNQVLLHADVAAKVDREDFASKRKAYAQSTFSLTLQVAGVPSWGVKEIEQRQKVLAALAVKTWKIA